MFTLPITHWRFISYSLVGLLGIFLSALFLTAKVDAAETPLAARLLAEPHTITGVRVSISNLDSDMRGLANDGETVYVMDTSGDIVTVPLSSINMTPGQAAQTATGTVHTVGWGVSGAPNRPGNINQLSMSYSSGCLFMTDDSNNAENMELYCIDTDDYSVTEIAVPSNKPLPVGTNYIQSNMIDFPDGRIGKVSRYTKVSNNYYTSVLRTYDVSGVGSAATITWSEDFLMEDTSTNYTDSIGWARDEHGIGTDGTYLYRIQWNTIVPNYKTWKLTGDGTAAQVVYGGSYTQPYNNMHYLSHNHKDNYYLMGYYNGNSFFITAAADPGPGPGNPFTPVLSSPIATADGYTATITNYTNTYTWNVSSDKGAATLSDAGVVTVSGLSPYESATVTVTPTKTGEEAKTVTQSGRALDAITGVAAAPSDTSATITFTTAGEASTQVVYGLDEYSATTTESDLSPRVQSHSVTLSGLLSCTTYQYQARAKDTENIVITSSNQSFTTTGCPGGVTPKKAVSNTIDTSTTSTTTLESEGTTLTVATPAGVATNSSLVIEVQAMDSASVLQAIDRPSGQANDVGDIVFDAKAVIDGTTILDSFDYPVTIAFQYPETAVRGFVENSLQLYHYTSNGAGGKIWKQLDSCTVDTGTNTISCTTDSFSVFALFGQKVAEAKNDSSSSSSSSSSGGTRFGCKDEKATNFQNFVAHKQSLCKYDTEVAPAAPVADSICSPYLTGYVSPQGNNNELEVKKLQTFLNEKQGEKLAVDGTYDADDIAAVKRFQAKYASEVLSIWGLTEPTGYVYRTTQLKINSFYCSASVQCPYFTEHNSLTENSSSSEVQKTKILLKDLGFFNGAINQSFGAPLHSSLKTFQETFSETMLTPWGLTSGTGYKYKTTNKFLNLLVGCKTGAVELDGRGVFDY